MMLPPATKLFPEENAYAIQGHPGIWKLAVGDKGQPLKAGQLRATSKGCARWFNYDEETTERLVQVLGYDVSADEWLVCQDCGEARPTSQIDRRGARCAGCVMSHEQPSP